MCLKPNAKFNLDKHNVNLNLNQKTWHDFFCVTGREFLGHRNDHSYSVIKTDFSLFDPEWTAEEELQLMNALLTHGHGNWDELAKCVPLKTSYQCKLHFDKFYIENR